MDLFAQQANTKPLTSAEQAGRVKELVAQMQLAGVPAEPQAAVGTDQLKLSQPGEFQYFGHAPKVTLSMLLKQPIWQDDRTKITSEQWHQMPDAQQQAILKLIPSEAARNQFVSNMDPGVAAAKEWLGGVGKGVLKAIGNGAARAAERSAQEHEGARAAEAEQAAQVDRLNALVDASDPK